MPDGPYYAAVDLGGTHLRVGLGTTGGGILRREVAGTDHSAGPNGVMRQIAGMTASLLAAAGVARGEVERLAVATPGPLVPETGTVYEAPNMPGWHEVAIVEDLERLIRVPVVAINDANAAALGEHAFGAGRGHRHLVYLTVSTGIGGGVIIDNHLLEGARGTAGELGHMTIDRDGPSCACGNVGCLEALASGTAIARRFRQRRLQGAQSTLSADSSAADIARAAAQGDRLAADVFCRAAEDLGFGVVNAIHIFSPQMVIIGGGVSAAGDLLFGPAREVVSRHAMAIPRGGVPIVPAMLGDNAGLYGALARASSG